MFTNGHKPIFFWSKLKKEKMLNRGLDKVELLRIVEAVANEKSIDKEIVLESMESAIQKRLSQNLEQKTIYVFLLIV
jgi:N utilization substance protein A